MSERPKAEYCALGLFGDYVAATPTLRKLRAYVMRRGSLDDATHFSWYYHVEYFCHQRTKITVIST